MTRQVYERSMVAHLWANRSQDSARDSGGRFYFTGGRLYSYGSHFIIGAHVETADGPRILWNSRTYSMTTTRHQSEAWRALAGWQTRERIVYVDGLGENDTRGRDWLLRLAQRMAKQAGEAFDTAANVKRASAKRDEAARVARQTADGAALLARTVAAGVGDADGATAADKRAARSLLKTLASLPDYPTDTAAQRDACAEAARILIREEKRAEMAKTAERSRSAADHAAGSADAGEWRDAMVYARNANALAAAAREMAKRYGLRVPALPDLRSLVARVEPLADNDAAHACAERARIALRDAEMMVSKARRFGQQHFTRSAVHEAERVLTGAENLCGLGRAELLPASVTERAAVILRRAQRDEAIRHAAFALSGVAIRVKRGDEYAQAGEMRRAAREYSDALRDLRAALETIPAGHPAWREHTGDHAAARTLLSYAVEAETRARAAFAAEDAAIIENWRDGAPTRPPHDAGPLLRLSADGRAIETSWGAHVPLAVAPLLWRLCNKARKASEPIAFRGDDAPRIGHFRLECVHAHGGITVGCHEIAWSELAYIAERLGYTSPASAAA